MMVFSRLFVLIFKCSFLKGHIFELRGEKGGIEDKLRHLCIFAKGKTFERELSEQTNSMNLCHLKDA